MNKKQLIELLKEIAHSLKVPYNKVYLVGKTKSVIEGDLWVLEEGTPVTVAVLRDSYQDFKSRLSLVETQDDTGHWVQSTSNTRIYEFLYCYEIVPKAA